MKKISLFFVSISFFLACQLGYGQCTPENAETCPDPENNGQVCPDSLVAGYFNIPYNEVITILPPPYFVFINDTVVLHHVTLLGLDNLPPGITWESNAPDDEFMAGEYSCILLDGTPTDSGLFQLNISVEVFVVILPSLPPISVGTFADSSLAMVIHGEYSNIAEYTADEFSITGCTPNPFNEKTLISFHSPENQYVWLYLYDLSGQCVHQARFMASAGVNIYELAGSGLRAGMYMCTLVSGDGKRSIKLIKDR